MPEGSQEYMYLQVSPALRNRAVCGARQINLTNEFILYITALTDRQPGHWCRMWWQNVNIDHTLWESSQAPPQQEAAMAFTLVSSLFNQFKMKSRLVVYIATDFKCNRRVCKKQRNTQMIPSQVLSILKKSVKTLKVGYQLSQIKAQELSQLSLDARPLPPACNKHSSKWTVLI